METEAENTESIFREYVIQVNYDEMLTLSSTPSHPNSNAFINGIEILSIPSDLYYMSGNYTKFKSLGGDELVYIARARV